MITGGCKDTCPMQRDQGWMDEVSMLLEPLALTEAAALPSSCTTRRDTTSLHAVLLPSARLKKTFSCVRIYTNLGDGIGQTFMVDHRHTSSIQDWSIGFEH